MHWQAIVVPSIRGPSLVGDVALVMASAFSRYPDERLSVKNNGRGLIPSHEIWIVQFPTVESHTNEVICNRRSLEILSVRRCSNLYGAAKHLKAIRSLRCFIYSATLWNDFNYRI